MSTNQRVFNFNAGPASLPLEVLEEIRDNFMNFGGMSVLEISHRSKEFGKILDDAKSLLKELMGIPADHRILFLQGGASTQFAMIPMNLLNGSAGYSITGYWAKKAAAEAKLFGQVNEPFSSSDTNFNKTPVNGDIKVSKGSSYLHITTNNTIYGTEYNEYPETGDIPLVADMSSDILSHKIDVNRFDLIYAGAQKNLGPAGVTVVVIRSGLAKINHRPLPAMMKYSTHVENDSLYNTPPVFTIYSVMLVLNWIKRSGGIEGIEKRNLEKAKLIYDAIDNSTFYKGTAEKMSRSIMNITFNLPTEDLEERFIKEAELQGLVGLKGHRAIGGVRASIYNVFPIEGAKALAEFMKEFERKI
ncbi:MAG: 3-phosphoserine/phosphohydroxythreonine aminotransferase [Deltaproteobacteria bacterium CG11_big_fil_rev_8_21_14_0_20_49_13]|nr:MAG: 3-phosphoserine/phosphohydroxythreonine aminotransferase [Deltaproteobacteria bacterium CG11_big_fil_rev_8_21_14_0_20_49_13]